MSLSGMYKISALMDFLIQEAKTTGREMYPVMVRIFLYIAENNKEGVTQTQVKDALNLVQTSAYRAIAALGEGTSKKPDSGLGFIQTHRNPADYRSDIITLTPKGQDFLERLTATITKDE